MTHHPRPFSPARWFVATATLALLTGCSRFTPGMRTNGYVAASYVSAVTPPVATDRVPRAAIRVAPLTHAAPDWELGGIGGLPRLFPLVSFLATPVVITNQIADDYNSRLPLQPGECERLLAAELTKAGLARAPLPPDAPADFELRGRMDFTTTAEMHFSGFGDIIYCFTILPLLAPMGTHQLAVTAHVELVALRTNQRLLSRDYTRHCRYFIGPLTGNNHRHFTEFGAKLLPPVIEQLTADLRALPADTWKVAPVMAARQ